MQIKITSRLKRALRTALRRGKGRKEVQATEHGQPVARLFPSHQASLSRHLRDMEKGGLARRGKRPLPADFWDLPRPTDPDASIRSMILREREEGR